MEQHDQINPCGFKFVLGGLSYTKVEFDIECASALSQPPKRHIEKIPR